MPGTSHIPERGGQLLNYNGANLSTHRGISALAEKGHLLYADYFGEDTFLLRSYAFRSEEWLDRGYFPHRYGVTSSPSR